MKRKLIFITFVLGLVAYGVYSYRKQNVNSSENIASNEQNVKIQSYTMPYTCDSDPYEMCCDGVSLAQSGQECCGVIPYWPGNQVCFGAAVLELLMILVVKYVVTIK